MTRRIRSCSKRISFPFLNLPADVQLLVLCELDPHTLRNIAQAIQRVQELILMSPSIVRQGLMTSMDPQLRGLLMTTFYLVQSMKAVPACAQPDLANMKLFLAENLDTHESRDFDMIQSNALGALDILCEIDAEVVKLARDYAQQAYECACDCDNPGAVIPPLILSPIEMHRLTRAFYRLKLFGFLFFHYPTHFGLNLESSIGDFFATLSAFELDEMIVAYHFLKQNDRYFPLTYMQKACIRTVRTPTQDDRPDSQDLCCQECVKYTSKDSLDAMLRLFWASLVDQGYSNEENHWAKPLSCLEAPIKIWDDVPETNEPSEGWLLWCEVRDGWACGVDGQEYMEYFSKLGYCFWAAARLENWPDVFTEAWFKEERHASGYYPWCGYCRGPCQVTM